MPIRRNDERHASNYSALLPGMDALGGKLDSTLRYEFINRSSGMILGVYQGSTASGAMLDAETNTVAPALSQQWRISSNQDGYFQIASANPGAGNTTNALDDSGASLSSGTAIVQSLANASQEEEWSVVSVGNGYFSLVKCQRDGFGYERRSGRAGRVCGAGTGEHECFDAAVANRSGALREF